MGFHKVLQLSINNRIYHAYFAEAYFTSPVQQQKHHVIIQEIVPARTRVLPRGGGITAVKSHLRHVRGKRFDTLLALFQEKLDAQSA